MVKNPDIVASVAAMTEKRPFTVGFAAETNDVETYARGKLTKEFIRHGQKFAPIVIFTVIRVSTAIEFHQVLVTLLIFCKKNKVIVFTFFSSCYRQPWVRR